MNRFETGEDLGSKICELLGLDVKYVKELVLRFPAHSCATVELTCYLVTDIGHRSEIKEMLQSYKLTKIDNEENTNDTK